jgi:hypothetical protein
MYFDRYFKEKLLDRGTGIGGDDGDEDDTLYFYSLRFEDLLNNMPSVWMK